MDTNPTVNSILDYFVPDFCRNDWQKFDCLDLSNSNDDVYTLRISYKNFQYTFKVDVWDREIQRCVVVCTHSDSVDVITRNDRASLTWVFARLADWQTPSCPSIVSRMWPLYDNALTLRVDSWHSWLAAAELEFAAHAAIPPMPDLAPQLLYG
jgi:hypothetical protein